MHLLSSFEQEFAERDSVSKCSIDVENSSPVAQLHRFSRLSRNNVDHGTYCVRSERDRGLNARKVSTPYVNHVPTMTGGVGFEDLARFYKVRCQT